MIAGDEEGHSDALLGIFDAIAPAASAALAALAAAARTSSSTRSSPTVPLSRHIFKAPTRFYKTGVVFLAYLNGLQDHFLMIGEQGARARCSTSPSFRLADRARVLHDHERGGANGQADGGARRCLTEAPGATTGPTGIPEAACLRPWKDCPSISPRCASNGVRGCRRGCLRHGIRAIAPWRDQVAAVGLTEAARLVREEGLQVTGLCRGGFFPAADAAGRLAAIDDNRRAVDEAAALGADCLVLVVGGLPAGSRDIAGARAMVSDGIAAVLPHAIAAGVPLAVEPLHPMYAADRACVNTLAQALDLCDALDSHRTGALGVAMDVYHCWWDPDLEAQLLRAGPRRLLAHHICDWLVPTRDLLTDRGMMGDGVVDLAGIRRMVEAAGFLGAQEVEIFSAQNWWKRPGDEVLKTCVERFRSV